MRIANNTVQWSNYFRPTPANLQYLSASIKTITGTAGLSLYVSDNKEIAFWLLVAGGLLDEASKFFGRIAHDVEQVTVEGKDLTIVKVDVPVVKEESSDQT